MAYMSIHHLFTKGDRGQRKAKLSSAIVHRCVSYNSDDGIPVSHRTILLQVLLLVIFAAVTSEEHDEFDRCC